ncbi:relaxase/mobilization nuclease domain-containing protein [Flavobacterium sp. TMP13]|uniref:relaxase/mobilization nuclease domain-containing protein n=1 Tax=Flavobacterium sp. TMP13 TaxID=3425950 RepID=UPI003D77E338
MVAIIKTGTSIRATVLYNENKISLGVAQCLGGGNCSLDLNASTAKNKLDFLQKQLQLNENVTRNSVHISLNFDRSENDISNEKLVAIANAYMSKIGFEKQPYILYRHEDAGHPHIHIVSIKVRSDGTRIDIHNIGRNQSEIARKSIEQQFGLVPAESHKKEQQLTEEILSTPKIIYGKGTTKSEIQKVLAVTIGTYKYTSIPELNAVLNQYNVQVDRGEENSHLFKNNGLLYRILDASGKPIGVPIKASLFYNKPTLSNLQQRFEKNKVDRTKYRSYVKNEIDKVLFKPIDSIFHFKNNLKNKGIHTALRTNASGIVYGITYVDHRIKCVFNGSDLGKAYSAKAVLEHCKKMEVPTFENALQNISPSPNKRKNFYDTKAPFDPMEYLRNNSSSSSVLELLLHPEEALNYVSKDFKKKKKNKRKQQAPN